MDCFLGYHYGYYFSAATAYSGLRFGQVFEAAIPIAIIAVGVSTVAKGKVLCQKMLLFSLSEQVRE